MSAPCENLDSPLRSRGQRNVLTALMLAWSPGVLIGTMSRHQRLAKRCRTSRRPSRLALRAPGFAGLAALTGATWPGV